MWIKKQRMRRTIGKEELLRCVVLFHVLSSIIVANHFLFAFFHCLFFLWVFLLLLHQLRQHLHHSSANGVSFSSSSSSSFSHLLFPSPRRFLCQGEALLLFFFNLEIINIVKFLCSKFSILYI